MRRRTPWWMARAFVSRLTPFDPRLQECSRSALDRRHPLCYLIAEGREFNTTVSLAIATQIAVSAGGQGTCPGQVAGRIMVQANRYLDQPLQEFLFLNRSFTPHVFQHFMAIVVVAAIEKLNALAVLRGVHIIGGMAH